jgi:hypothetical protein
MTSLQRFEQDGIELVINTETGEAFATQSAVARMVDKGESTIRAFITSQKIEVKTAKVLTTTGLKTSQLLDEKSIVACLFKYNLPMAEKFTQLGVRVGLHQLAGYKVTTTAVQQQPSNTLSVVDGLNLLRSSLLNCIAAPLVEGVIINGIARICPEIAPEVKEAHKLLAATTESEVLLTPTSIGARLGISNRKVNIMLLNLGFQTKNIDHKKGEPGYLATPKGLSLIHI